MLRSFRRHILLLVAVSSLAACAVQLQGPSGNPQYQPSGLYLQMDGDTLRVLSIACGTIRHSAAPDQEKCFFVHQIRIFRDLAFSGKRIEITERWGTMEMDPDEALLTRVVFVRYHSEIREGEEWQVEKLSGPVVDRELTGDDTFLHLKMEDGCLRDDNGCWHRRPGNVLLADESAFLSEDQGTAEAEDPSSDPEADPGRKEQKMIFSLFPAPSSNSELAFSPALDFFLRNGVVRQNEEILLQNSQCKKKVRVTHFGGGYLLLQGIHSDKQCGDSFTLMPETKQKWNLAELYSLRTGTGTPMEAGDGEQTEKEKRRKEIREKIKRGEEVTQEELLEVLED